MAILLVIPIFTAMAVAAWYIKRHEYRPQQPPTMVRRVK